MAIGGRQLFSVGPRESLPTSWPPAYLEKEMYHHLVVTLKPNQHQRGFPHHPCPKPTHCQETKSRPSSPVQMLAGGGGLMELQSQ